MTQDAYKGRIDGIVGRAKAPQSLSGVYDVFQAELFGLKSGSRIGFPSALSRYLEANYPGKDRDNVYGELLKVALDYDKEF